MTALEERADDFAQARKIVYGVNYPAAAVKKPEVRLPQHRLPGSKQVGDFGDEDDDDEEQGDDFDEDDEIRGSSGGSSVVLDSPVEGVQVDHQDDDDDFEKSVTLDVRSRDELDWKALIGVGRFGRVYQATDLHTGRNLAVKVLDKCKVLDEVDLEMIKKEKGIFHNLSHPFVVRFYGYFHDWNQVYFLMEHCTGGDFSSFLLKAGTLNEEVARFYMAEIALALEYIHSRQLVYRDLKPENILLDHNGHIRIGDFGFAKKCPNKTKTLLGTPEYVAPELISGNGYGREVDWWALGIVFYEMLTGETPFLGGANDAFEIYAQIVKCKYDIPPRCSVEAESLMTGLICKIPAERLGYYSGAANEGAVGIKAHRFFEGLDWNELKHRRIRPPIDPSSLSFGRMLYNQDTAPADDHFLSPSPSPISSPMPSSGHTSLYSSGVDPIYWKDF